VLFGSITDLPEEVRAEIPGQLVWVSGVRLRDKVCVLFEAEDDIRFAYIFERTDAGYRLACASAPLPMVGDSKPNFSFGGDDIVIHYRDASFAFHRDDGSEIWELFSMGYEDANCTASNEGSDATGKNFQRFSPQGFYPVERDLTKVDITALPWTLADAFALYDTERTEAGAQKAGIKAEVSSSENEYIYLAVLSRFYSPATKLPYLGGIDDTSRFDVDRIVHAQLIFSRSVALLLPEGSGTEEDYAYVGARVTFDSPFEVSQGSLGNEIINLSGYVILEPKRVEIIGDMVYGEIVEISENHMILDARGEDARPTGNHTRYTITPDTLMWYESPFEKGSGCEAIVDQDGVVLAMAEANG